MDFRDRMKSVLEDEEVLEELREGAFLEVGGEDTESMASGATAPDPRDIGVATDRVRTGSFDPDALLPAEAIIVRFGYPSLLVQNGTYKKPKLQTWRKRLDPHRRFIDRAISGVGRIELKGHPSHKWVGTGWMIDEVTVVTNRHVADFFSLRRDRKAFIVSGLEIFIDYREEHGSEEAFETEINEILHIESQNSGVDLAFLRLKSSAPASANVTPLSIAEEVVDVKTIGVIGYPAFDPRNSPADQARIFEDIYNKKRFAPGEIIGRFGSSPSFSHNCTTLGGNSGSCVIDVTSGQVVGLHFGGREGEQNRAVRADVIRDRAARAKIRIAAARAMRMPEPSSQVPAEAPKHSVEHYEGRSGYDTRFLGNSLTVPLPKLNALQQRDVAALGDGTIELKYEHFSVVMNAARRLAFFTACNIDGTDLWHKRRGNDKWFVDPRIDQSKQVDNDLYVRNDFDRGHMVRRLDPVWGPKSEAELAEQDTFHYTNAAPQHKELNRAVWVNLENHILNGADEVDAKISVLTGPVFGYADPRSKRVGLEEVGIPLGFWKIVASIGRDRRRRRVLQAQAFVIWQHDMVAESDLERVFGQGFQTYQVSVTALERLTGLDFQNLRDADTFGEDLGPGEESFGFDGPAASFTRRAQVIRDTAEII